MPPKMFKIKKAEQAADDDNADALVISDYQQQRLQQQAKQAEQQHADETRRAAAAEGETVATTAVSGMAKVKAEDSSNTDGKEGMSKRVAHKLATNASAATTRPTATSSSSYVTFSQADVLPVNTMDAVLGAPAPADGNHYQPMMLKPPGVGGDAPAASASGGGVESDNADVATTNGVLSPQPPARKNGTAFLEEGHRERLAAYASNKEFFDTHGQGARANRSDARLDDVTGADDDAFMLMQLPKPIRELASSCALDQMAPGRVGKLTVYKSGRATMTIGGVTVDVSLEPQRGADGSSAASGPATVAEGISQFAVAVDGNDLARRGCYQLCWIPRKVVCTPQLDEE